MIAVSVSVSASVCFSLAFSLSSDDTRCQQRTLDISGLSRQSNDVFTVKWVLGCGKGDRVGKGKEGSEEKGENKAGDWGVDFWVEKGNVSW